MSRFPLIHSYGLGEAMREPLRRAFPERELRVLDDAEAFRAAIPEMEVLVALRPPRGLWARAARLRLIQLPGAGVDALLPAPDLPPPVRVANARGVHAASMGEWALAMMLALAKRVPHAFAQQRERRWAPFGPRRLAGKTCGVLGMGSIGSAVAARARQQGMRVLGVRRTPTPSPDADEVVGPADIARVVAESDFLVVLLPLTDATRGLLDAAMLDRMKPDAMLVNLARGGIVDEVAVAQRLEDGRLGGAAFDVFAEEPLPAESPLWDAPNCIVTPHVAGLSAGYMERVAEIFVENIQRLERDEPLRNAVDRARGY